MKPHIAKTETSLRSYDPFVDPAETMRQARVAQASWERVPLSERIGVVRRFRHALVEQALEMAEARSREGGRSAAEVLASEVMPLADACRFLERQARRILAPRKVGTQGRPLWLTGTTAEVRREAYGLILLIAPSNYPVFLPGVQLMQALVAGNAVLLKPGVGGSAPALALARMLLAAGLPIGLVRVLPEIAEAAQSAIRIGVEKVVFTGSAATGTQVLSDLAARATPSTMELSGCDAVFVRADADLDLAVKSIVFGLKLNRGRTCIGPRRVFVSRSVATEFEGRLAMALENLRDADRNPEELSAEKNFLLLPHVLQALASGAHVLGGSVSVGGRLEVPLVLCGVPATSRLLKEDFFAPVLSVLTYGNEDEAVEIVEKCPYALGVTIFSRNVLAARLLAKRLSAGVVVINDMIVPTADPRLPFGGRKLSGFGVTRGPEGLLELTVPKVISVNRAGRRPHLEPSKQGDEELFDGYLKLVHGKGLVNRMMALGKLWQAIFRRGGAAGKRAIQIHIKEQETK